MMLTIRIQTRRLLNHPGRFILSMLVAVFFFTAEVIATEGGSLRFGVDGTDLSMSTDFWRSAFGNSVERPDEQANEGGNETEVQQRTQSLPELHALDGSDSMMSDLPIASSEQMQDGQDAIEDIAMMSDWETSESQATGGKGKTFTKDGPSAVTAIVAIVGFIVVGGAYLSGRKPA